MMTRRAVQAPAKINLGLEILGRRPDGYHEIRSILCKITLHDTLEFEPAHAGNDHVRFTPDGLGIDPRDDLVARALGALRARGARLAPQRVTVTKRIPASSGLGGASSDAAATLKAFEPEARDAGLDIAAIAPELGSDVPFFLNGPIARVAGRGEVISPLSPPLDGPWVMLVTPRVEIGAKTASMYRSIDPAWWTSGSAIDAIAERLPDFPETVPPNVFERALLRRFPALEEVKAAMMRAGAPYVALSGAGPTFYCVLDSPGEASVIAGRVAGLGTITNVARAGCPDEP